MLNLNTAHCDTHVHVFDPAHYPYDAARSYTPPPATTEQLQAHLAATGCARVVLVQATVYGKNNEGLLHALRALNSSQNRTARGVAVLDWDAVQDSDILALHAAGVRGVRINVRGHVKDEQGLQAIRRQLKQAQRLRGLGAKDGRWHVQVYAHINTHAALLSDYAELGLPVVMDHFAGAGSSDVDHSAALRDVLNAIQVGMLYTKLSAAYRLPQDVDVALLARLFYKAAPRRVLWGSDWPHTGGALALDAQGQAIQSFRSIDNPSALQVVLNALAHYPEASKALLVDNPAELYDF